METISETQLAEQFEDMIDEIYGEFDVAGVTISASRVLREADPIAYRVAMFDYLDSLDVELED